MKLSPKFQMNIPTNVILDRDGLRYEQDGVIQSQITDSYGGEIDTTGTYPTMTL